MLIPISKGAEPDIDKYAARSNLERANCLAFVRSRLVDVQNDRDVRIGFTRDDLNRVKAERKASISVQEKRIADLENPLLPYYGRFEVPFDQLNPGNIGWFQNEELRVLQFIDKANVLVKTQSKTMWVSGVQTSGLEDNGPITLNGLFAVTGNKTYETSSGSNTVFVLEYMDAKPFEHKFTRRSELRKWTSKNGNHTTDAIFVRSGRGSVTIMGLDGKSKVVKLVELADDDGKFVQEQARKDAELQKKIPPQQRYRQTKNADGSISLEAE